MVRRTLVSQRIGLESSIMITQTLAYLCSAFRDINGIISDDANHPPSDGATEGTMSDSPENRAAELVEQGANALKVGNIAEAYAVLREAVKLEPNNERAWLWLAGAVPGDDQRRFCLERVLQINPENSAAKRGLSALPAANTQPAYVAPSIPTAPPPTLPTPAARPTGATATLRPTPFDPLAQALSTPRATPPPPSTPIQSDPPLSPTSAERARDPEPVRIVDGPQPSRNSLELLQREQQDQPVPSNTNRPSFVKPRFGKEPKSDPKAGKPTTDPAVGGNAMPSIRPNIPIITAKRRLDRGTIALIGLVVTLLVVLGLIAFLVYSQISSGNNQLIQSIPTEPAVIEPTATTQPEATATASVPTVDPAPLLAQARTLAESGNNEQAIEVYTQILANSENADAFFERGNAYFALNKLPDAIADFSATLRLRPGFAEAYENRGRANLRANHFQESITDYTEALRLNPNNPTSYLRRGIAYQQSGDYPMAQADFTSAIQLKDDYIEAYWNRGNALRQQGDYDSAVIAFNAALKLKANYIPALIGRGNTEIDAKHFRAGVEDCTRAATADPNIPEPYYCRGRAYAGLKQYQQALDDFGRALELNPDQPDVLRDRGRTQLLLGDKTAARDDFEQAANLYEQFGDTENLAITRAELEQLK